MFSCIDALKCERNLSTTERYFAGLCAVGAVLAPWLCCSVLAPVSLACGSLVNTDTKTCLAKVVTSNAKICSSAALQMVRLQKSLLLISSEIKESFADVFLLLTIFGKGHLFFLLHNVSIVFWLAMHMMF